MLRLAVLKPAAHLHVWLLQQKHRQKWSLDVTGSAAAGARLSIKHIVAAPAPVAVPRLPGGAARTAKS